MIKQKKLYVSVAIFFWSLMTTQLCASTFWDYRDIKQFPIQQSIVEPVKQTWIQPVEMTSWGFGKSYVYYYPSFLSMFSSESPQFSFRPTQVYELKRDFPFGKSDRSFGMDITLFEDFFWGKVSNNGRFSDFRGFDILGNYKLKKMLSTKLGDIIGIVVTKFGIAGVLKGLDEKKDAMGNLDRVNSIYYPLGFGAAAGIGLGIDYYPSQWLGIFIEYSVKRTQIISWLSPPSDNASHFYPYKRQEKSYSYYPATITFGLKTTF